MLDNLPIEISTDILHRLEVKTLIKCTTLSKSFLSLITSQAFISTHIATKHTHFHLLFRYLTLDSKEIYHFDPDDETFSGFQSQGLLVPFLDYTDSCFTVAGCVNGVLCLVNDFRTEGTLIILWNPSIKKFLHVPLPILVYRTYGPYESVCGFGFDSISDDYKVVRVVDLDAAYFRTPRVMNPPSQVEVYSLKSGCWRVIGDGPNYSIKRHSSGYIPRFINGSVYWVGYKLFPNKYVIVKFDMSTESFEIIQLPDILIENESTFTENADLYVQECKGDLSLIMRNYYGDIKTCYGWLMKEVGGVRSWTKMFDFDFAKLRLCGMPRAFAFRKNGEVIMVQGGGNENVVVSTNLVTHGETALRELRVGRFPFYLSTYVESMVLFKEGEGIKEQTTPLDLLKRVG
ncbi:hypothetical protein KSS87_021656 [Heliosperma pusillum]|nr:hypothetical protein KSS87_021656 [Heliosperma pusillum]